MLNSVFITGTDTSIGKTWFTLSLMNLLKERGYKVLGMKPIASGAVVENDSLINDDARLIMEAGSEPAEYKFINPVVYEQPVSPNIAAALSNKELELDKIVDCYRELESQCEKLVVEGVGGWRVPVSDELSLVDMVRALGLPVILVVGLRLGCINHAILTAEAIKKDGLSLVGWVCNQLDENYKCIEETIKTINTAIDCPCIAHMPFNITHTKELVLERTEGEFSEFLNS